MKKALIPLNQIGVVSTLLLGVNPKPEEEAALIKSIVQGTGVKNFQVLLGGADFDLRRQLFTAAGATGLQAIAMWPGNAPDPFGATEDQVDAAVAALLQMEGQALELGCSGILGPVLAPWLPSKLRTEAERVDARAFVRQAFAAWSGKSTSPLWFGLEPLNRFELDIVNTAGELGEIISPPIPKVHALLDISHASMESWSLLGLQQHLHNWKQAGVGAVQVHLSAASRGRILGTLTQIVFPAFLQLILREFPDAQVHIEGFTHKDDVLGGPARMVRDALQVPPLQFVEETVEWLLELDGERDYVTALVNAT